MSAVNDINAAKAMIAEDAEILRKHVQGPASGPDSSQEIAGGTLNSLLKQQTAHETALGVMTEAADAAAADRVLAQGASADAREAARVAEGAIGSIATAAGLIQTTPFRIPGVGWCVAVGFDPDRRPVFAVTEDNRRFGLSSTGYLVELSGGGSPGAIASNDNSLIHSTPFILPDGSAALYVALEGNRRPAYALGDDGGEWTVVNGVLTRRSGAVQEAYTGAAGRRTVYNNSEEVVDAQSHSHAASNVVYAIFNLSQSLGGSNNDKATFTGEINDNVLTVVGPVVGEIRAMDRLFWAGIDTSIGATQTRIVQQLSPTTWEVSPSQTRTSIAMECRDTSRTTTPIYPDKVLMPGIEGQSYGLVRPGGANIDRLVPGIEQDIVFDDPVSGYWKETGLVAMANRLVELCSRRLGYSPTFLVGHVGTGGTPYRGHTRGTPNGTELRRIIQRCSDILQAQGKRLIVLGIRYRGGEENNKGNTLARENARHHCQLIEHLNIDIKRITGQTETVQLFANQCNRRSTSPRADAGAPLGPLMAMDLDPRINCTGPIYWADASSDGGHVLSWSYLAMGVVDAHHIFSQCFDVGARPQRVRKAYRVAADRWRIDYELPVGLDSTVVDGTADSVATNAGLLFQDGSGAPSQTVSSVAVVGGSQAAGTLTFTGVGVAGNTITIGEHTFTLVASGATGAQVDIGGSAAATAQNVKTYINAHELQCQVTVTGASNVLTLTSRHNRSGGSISTTCTGTACAFGAATLTGGAFSYTLEVTLSGAPTGYDPRFIYATYAAAGGMGNKVGARGRIRAGVPLDVARDDRVAGGLVEVFDWASTETIRLMAA